MNRLTFKQLRIVGVMLMLLVIMRVLSLTVGITLPYLLHVFFMFSIYFFVFLHIFKERIFYKKIYIVFLFYLIYLFVQVIHGFFNAYNYWHVKELMMNTTSLLIPMFALFFYKPTVCISVLNTWKEILNPNYLFIFLFLLIPGYIHFLLGPAYFLFGIFIFWLPRKWLYIIGCVLVVMVTMSLDSRSQVLKGLVTVAMAFGVYYRKYVPIFCLSFFYWFFYFISITLVILGLTGVYNVFSPEITEGEKILMQNNKYGNENNDDEINKMTVDTRTFIYLEVISSAIENDYIIFGRSPARGNDTEHFAGAAEELDEGFIERSGNELCHLNVFTWIGIVGVILYSFLYFQASFLALYRSRNNYVKYFAILVAFHWAYGWVEDRINFDMMNVGLWLVIGICLSNKFREMNNKEFELWFKSIFTDNCFTPYHKYELEKELSVCEKIVFK